MEQKLSILIVEDEESILHGLVDVFVYHGFAVDTATDGEVGLQKAQTGKYDLLLLDVMVPRRDGFSICNEIRSLDPRQPIVLLTAKTSEEDIITGLTLGADDYIAKPFSVRELVLRVESVLRRSQKVQQRERTVSFGPSLQIDTANLVGELEGQDAPLPFTRREVDMLLYLRDHNDRPISRDELLAEVWGYVRNAQIETRTVDIHIAKLRKKIEQDPKNPTLLVTVRGEGYKLELGEE
ncbi:MAG: response regulator transcription factor [Bdellovibrionales bacterium]|nr:response regulator transcription factor [Bdellovibrionales bacterium]